MVTLKILWTLARWTEFIPYHWHSHLWLCVQLLAFHSLSRLGVFQLLHHWYPWQCHLYYLDSGYLVDIPWFLCPWALISLPQAADQNKSSLVHSSLFFVIPLDTSSSRITRCPCFLSHIGFGRKQTFYLNSFNSVSKLTCTTYCYDLSRLALGSISCDEFKKNRYIYFRSCQSQTSFLKQYRQRLFQH